MDALPLSGEPASRWREAYFNCWSYTATDEKAAPGGENRRRRKSENRFEGINFKAV